MFFIACSGKKAPQVLQDAGKAPLIIWTYDSLVSQWGPAAAIAENFKTATGNELSFVSQGDGGLLLTKALAQGEKAGVDIIMGLNNDMLNKAINSKLFMPYRPRGAENLYDGLALDAEFRLVPWDWGSFAFIFDSEYGEKAPESLEDLCNPRWKKKIILMDPRTSSPGLGFFSWVKEVYGEDWQAYWKRLMPSILTIADGWDSGYGMFTRGEAPLVLSYNTSPAYHVEYEDSDRFKALIFSDGHVNQIEFAGILHSSPRKELAKSFMDFMLTEGFQSTIPLGNWMYPVVPIDLPDSFKTVPLPQSNLPSSVPTNEELDVWAALFD